MNKKDLLLVFLLVMVVFTTFNPDQPRLSLEEYHLVRAISEPSEEAGLLIFPPADQSIVVHVINEEGEEAIYTSKPVIDITSPSGIYTIYLTRNGVPVSKLDFKIMASTKYKSHIIYDHSSTAFLFD